MRIPVSLLILLIFIPVISISADTGITGVDTIFLPKEYYVGDKIR